MPGGSDDRLRLERVLLLGLVFALAAASWGWLLRQAARLGAEVADTTTP